jgi:exosome complex RNA-binding protein Rrp4
MDINRFLTALFKTSLLASLSLLNAAQSQTPPEPGVVWTVRNVGLQVNLYGVTSAGGLSVAVGDNGIVLVSRDTLTWSVVQTSQTPSFSYRPFLSKVAHRQGLFVAVGSNGDVFTSEDGV